MPEFILDTDGKVPLPSHHGGFVRWSWGGLDAFTQGYIEALFFTDSGPDKGQLGEAGFADLAPQTLQRIIEDCAAFQKQAISYLADAYLREDYSAEQAGRDFWFTRNGHGVGFWDREQLFTDGLGNVLTAVAHEFGRVDTYLCDDERVGLI